MGVILVPSPFFSFLSADRPLFLFAGAFEEIIRAALAAKDKKRAKALKMYLPLFLLALLWLLQCLPAPFRGD